MSKYIIPFYYTFKYNRKGFEGLAYFLEYPVFILIFNYMSVYNLEKIGTTIVLLIGTMLIYEIGYIQNNVLAIKYEKNPTLRHSKDEINYIDVNYKKIVLYRMLLLTFILYYSFLIKILSYEELVVFLFLGFILYVVYYLYNFKFRNGIFNRALFTGLRYLRYYMPFFYYDEWYISCLIICLLNLINNYSWYDRSKIKLPNFFGTKLFDLIYYLFVSIFLKKFIIMVLLKTVLIILIYPQKIKINKSLGYKVKKK